MLKIAALAIIVIIFGLIFFDVGFITSRYIKPHLPFAQQYQQTSNPIISGVVKVNGPIPAGSSISIGVRDHGSTGNYSIFASGLPAADETPWQYSQVKDSQSYDLQAYLILNGQKQTTSDPLTVTAPATEEELTLNIQSQPALPQTAAISGVVYINGYIPQGAVFDILARPYGSQGNFTVAINNQPAQIKTDINYPNANSGVKYEVKGQLIDKNGLIIGSSSSLVISAPSDNAKMEINSTAQPPAGSITPLQNNISAVSASPVPNPTGASTGSATISGIINFNGSAPSGTSIVILARPDGPQNQYQVVVNGIQPQNGATWSWNGAAAGTTYDLVAVLKGQVNGDQNIDYADSQTYIVAAPAQNQIFTLNTGIALGQPTGSVSITCGTKTNNVWNNNTVNFSSVSGAQYYSFQVGSTSGGSDITNVTQAASSNQNQTINISNLNDSVIYYAQYAVSSVSNPTPAQYSPYSTAYTIKCPN